MKIIRPLRFDHVRRASKNKKRRDARREREAKRMGLMRFFNRIFWFGIEPEIMWDATDFGEQGVNDNDCRTSDVARTARRDSPVSTETASE